MELKFGFLHPYIFLGPEGLLVEGVRKIKKWESDCFELVAGVGIRVEGKRLTFEHKSLDSLLIKGFIEKIEIVRSKR